MSAAIVSSFHHDYRDLYKGLQSHRAASDLRQQMNAFERQINSFDALERQINSYTAAASPLFNIPVSSQTSSAASTLGNLSSLAAVKSPLKQHAPLASSNSVAICSAPHTKAAPTSSKEHRKLDRSISEPADRSQASVRPAPPNSSRYKTELCRPFAENGSCKYGDKCQFAHGDNELRSLNRHPKYKTELCRTFHTTGFCPYGPRCHFIHNSEDAKCLFPALQTSPVSNQSASPPKHSSPPPAMAHTEFSNYSLGSAGELSPCMSSASSSSPTSISGNCFLDIPRSAPPIVSGGGLYYGTDYNTALCSLPNLAPTSDFGPTHQQRFDTPEDTVMSLISGMDSMSLLPRDGPKADAITSKTEQNLSVDVNRKLRLPIFNELAHGSSLQ